MVSCVSLWHRFAAVPNPCRTPPRSTLLIIMMITMITQSLLYQEDVCSVHSSPLETEVHALRAYK